MISGVLKLPALLREHLDVVFVSINPSIYSAEAGHYFARPGNKFWPCISRSVLTLAARTALEVEQLGPEHDTLLPQFGIGFTDLVERATARATDVAPEEFVAGVAIVTEKLERYRPRVACFQGMTAYRYVHGALTGKDRSPALGLQPMKLGGTPIFVVPNPSGANAHFSRSEQTEWYDQLAAYLATQ